MDQDKPGLGAGERAPDFALPLAGSGPTRFYAIAGGKPTVLLFCASDEAGLLRRLVATLQEVEADRVAVAGVKAEREQADSDNSSWNEMPVPVFSDAEGKVRRAYRLQDVSRSVLFVLDANLRVLDSFLVEGDEKDVQAVFTTLNALVPVVEPTQIVGQAPVLLIPNVLEPKICEFLVTVWEKQGSKETGVEQSQADRRQETISADHKRRRDHVVMEQQMLQLLSSTIGRRVMPEIQKSFAFRATRFEGFKIACYDAAAGGFFHAHRDNLSPATAHRRFALTLNLNGGYEGGFLRFPEYGPYLYRPERGAALVFSCSHLHEVTAVTQGKRFTLLSFLFGDADERASQPK